MESKDAEETGPAREAAEIGIICHTNGDGGTSNKCQNADASKPKCSKPTAPTDVLREQKVLETLLQFTEFGQMLSLRLICRAWNEILINSPLFLDTCKYLLSDAKSLELFANSEVNWKRVMIGYWPQTFDRYPGGARMGGYKFWETKAPNIIEVIFKLQKSVKMTSQEFSEMLDPLENLQSFTIASNLTQFNFLEYGWQTLRRTFANVKHLTVTDLVYLRYYCHHDFQIHIQNCYCLLKLVPPSQLKSFYVSATDTFADDLYADGTSSFLGTFVESSIQDHVTSIKNFRYDHLIPPNTLSEICNSEAFQLENLSLNLSTLNVFEKSKVEDTFYPDIQYAQVKAWRSFHQFLKRQQELNTLQIYIRQMNKKIAKQLFPDNIQATMRTLFLRVDDCSTEESFRFLSKLMSLKSLTLDVYNFHAIKKHPQFNFFLTLPSTLESVSLISIAYPPASLIELVGRLSKLKTLRIYNGSSMLTDESVQAIVQSLPALRELFLAPAFQVGDAGFIGKGGTSRITELRRLMLRDAKITNSTLRRGFSFKNVHYLDINGCSKVSHRGILDLAQQTPQLQWLHIMGIPFLPSAEKKLLAKLPNLYISKGTPENEQKVSNHSDHDDDGDFPEKYEMVELDPKKYRNN